MASSTQQADAGTASEPDLAQYAVSSTVPPANRAGAAPGRPGWPIRSGTVPKVADGFSARMETAPGLSDAQPAGPRSRSSPIGLMSRARWRLPVRRTG